MRILYGVVGEGLGHAVRSRVVIQHLLDQGHEVHMMTSQRAFAYLSRHFRNVNRIHGLHLVARGNRICKGRTLASNLGRGLTRLPANISAYFRLIAKFRPELVISDFESWSHLYGKVHRLPVISIDNMQGIARCVHPQEILAGKSLDYWTSRSFIELKMAMSAHYIVTSMFDMQVARADTSLMRPILRPELLQTRPTEGKHLLVYQTFDGNGELEHALKALGMECRVYGMRRGLKQEQVEGLLRHRPISEQGFIDDLASAKAVVGPGGFSLMSEAIHLRKPMLSVPILGQFEQEFNGRYLEHCKWGQSVATIDRERLESFLAELPTYRHALNAYQPVGNRPLLNTLDRLIEDFDVTNAGDPQLQAAGGVGG